MNIEIGGDLRIVNGANDFILQERYLYTPVKPDEDGVVPPPEYKWRDKWYYGKLEQALKGVLDYRMLHSEATSLAELAQEIAKVKAEISALFQIEGGNDI